MSVISISLAQLLPSDANVRKTGGGNLDDLAASIAAHGLLQCLNVRPRPGGKYDVVAGGRRLAALKRLVKEKRIAKNFPVPCRVLEEGEDAAEVSLAENQIRQAMHPADQFGAFKALSDNGMAVADIAARFGVAERTVEQRLKLARVSPALFELYRADAMTLEQLMVFTLSNDHAQQEAVWQAVSATYDTSARAIRHRLSEDKVSCTDRRARFIGEERFLTAGGTITRDLFSTADACFFEPPALLDRLVAETLEEAAEAVRTEGWAWVEAAERLDRSRYQAVPPTVRDYTEDEQAQVDRLIQQADEIALSGSDDDEDTYLALQEQLDALEAACHSFPEEMKASAGAVVHLTADGTIGIERGCLRREDAEAMAPALPARAVEAKPKPELSASLLEELTAHRTQAMQAVLARTPSVALDALVHGLALSSLYDRPPLSCLQIAATTRYPLMSSAALAETVAAQVLAELREQWTQALPDEAEQLWPWLRQAEQAVKLDLLAYLVAESLNAVQSGVRDAAPGAQMLHAALGIDMAGYWSATAAGYFGRVSRGKVIEALSEAQALVPDADRMTKTVLAGLAEQRIAGTRWLPPVLRCPVEAMDEAEALDEAA